MPRPGVVEQPREGNGSTAGLQRAPKDSQSAAQADQRSCRPLQRCRGSTCWVGRLRSGPGCRSEARRHGRVERVRAADADGTWLHYGRAFCRTRPRQARFLSCNGILGSADRVGGNVVRGLDEQGVRNETCSRQGKACDPDRPTRCWGETSPKAAPYKSNWSWRQS